VNLREQQDAVEFFMSLVESLDEALKALRQDQVMSKVLGGSYSDQKICKGCPHRYSKEEPFSVISVDIRNHSNLLDSLEQYVKGELLEGADAYHCEKCNAKVSNNHQIMSVAAGEGVLHAFKTLEKNHFFM
jgi:ubiquitin carboxyl-terminal hydrolase 9/24